MKKSILLLCTIAIGFVSCEKEEDVLKIEVPSAVMNAFETEFPNAVDVEWEKIGARYEADFDVDRVEYAAVINATGTVEKVKYDILTTDLPEEVMSAISTNYPDKTIDDSDVLVINEEQYYQIEFENLPTDIHVIFDSAGNEAPGIAYWE